MRAGHPLTQNKVTKERLFEFSHLVVGLTRTEERAADGFRDDKGVARRASIERALLEFQDGTIDLVGRVAVCVPHFAAVPPLLQATDMVATLPHRLALWAAAHFPLVLLDLPYTPKTVDIEIVCDQSADRDKGLQWLIDECASWLQRMSYRCKARLSNSLPKNPRALDQIQSWIMKGKHS